MIEHSVLEVFPSDDEAFARYARQCLAELDHAEPDPKELERLLRRWHGRAVVRVQSDLGRLSAEPAWYVYRDGVIARSESGWWQQDGAARLTFDRDGTFLDANEAAATLVGRPREQLVGAHWSTLVGRAAHAVDPQWLWAMLDDGLPVQSTFELARPDGGLSTIEYRSEPTGEPGVFVTHWRRVAVD